MAWEKEDEDDDDNEDEDDLQVEMVGESKSSLRILFLLIPLVLS